MVLSLLLFRAARCQGSGYVPLNRQERLLLGLHSLAQRVCAEMHSLSAVGDKKGIFQRSCLVLLH